MGEQAKPMMRLVALATIVVSLCCAFSYDAHDSIVPEDHNTLLAQPMAASPANEGHPTHPKIAALIQSNHRDEQRLHAALSHYETGRTLLKRANAHLDELLEMDDAERAKALLQWDVGGWAREQARHIERGVKAAVEHVTDAGRDIVQDLSQRIREQIENAQKTLERLIDTIGDAHALIKLILDVISATGESLACVASKLEASVGASFNDLISNPTNFMGKMLNDLGAGMQNLVPDMLDDAGKSIWNAVTFFEKASQSGLDATVVVREIRHQISEQAEKEPIIECALPPLDHTLKALKFSRESTLNSHFDLQIMTDWLITNPWQQ